jgi:serine/threonine-protein kinase
LAILEKYCGDNAALRAAVEQLLAHDAEASHDNFLEPITPTLEMRPADLPQHIGAFDILSELGRGGMGVVYHARQRGANRIVALKVIRADLLGLGDVERRQFLERFRLEAQAAARIEHEHVIPVYDVGEADGMPYDAMRYVAGRSLAQVLHEHPLDCKTAATLTGSVARGVQAAHTHGLLHRDLKPANMLVDECGRPYVTDFGVVKWLKTATGMTQTGDILGTPAYMAPEQADGAAGAGVASAFTASGRRCTHT